MLYNISFSSFIRIKFFENRISKTLLNHVYAQDHAVMGNQSKESKPMGYFRCKLCGGRQPSRRSGENRKMPQLKTD